MPAAAPRKYNVILADDDIDDQFLISRAIDETHIDHMLYTVPNGL